MRQTLVIEIEVEAPDYLTDFPHDNEELDDLRYAAMWAVMDAAFDGLEDRRPGLPLSLVYNHGESVGAIHTKAVYLSTGGEG